jgi:hypothetical protein
VSKIVANYVEFCELARKHLPSEQGIHYRTGRYMSEMALSGVVAGWIIR